MRYPLLLLLLAACGADRPVTTDPLSSLTRDPGAPPLFSEHYWSAEQRSNTTLWRNALATCQTQSTRSCMPVLHVHNIAALTAPSEDNP